MNFQRKNLRLYLIMAGLSLSIVFFLGEMLVRIFLPVNNPDTIRRYSIPYLQAIFARHRIEPIGRMVEDADKALGKKSEDAMLGSGVFINTVGYRGHNFVVRKPGGVTRIIIIGGSTVFDIYRKDVSADENGDWPHLVERLLRHKGFNVEVINGGIPGHASFDALGLLYSQLWMYQPDYVLFYGAWNDIKYFREVTPETPLISLFGRLGEKSNPFTEYQGFWDRLLSKSQLYVKIRTQYYGWKLQVGKEGVVPEGAYEDHYSAYAIEQYRLNAALIVDTCKEINAVPVLLTEATIVSPDNSVEDRKMIRYEYQLLTHSALVKAFDDTYRVIRSVAQEKRVPFLDVAKEMNGQREYFADHVHFTTKGSEEIAKMVTDFMAQYLENHHPTQYKPKM